MNNIIGGNLNSRLFQHVREDKGLSYAIYSYGSAFKQCGLFQIDAAMNPEQTIQVLEAIKEVIGSLFEKAPITEHELHLAKNRSGQSLSLIRKVRIIIWRVTAKR